MATSISDRANILKEDFDFLETWEDRYGHIIALGRALPEFPAEDMNDANKVRGCASQVWMVGEIQANQVKLIAASDASIVSGLIALLVELYDGASVEDARAFDVNAFFDALGLRSSLSAQRSNGLAAMVQRIVCLLA